MQGKNISFNNKWLWYGLIWSLIAKVSLLDNYVIDERYMWVGDSFFVKLIYIIDERYIKCFTWNIYL